MKPEARLKLTLLGGFQAHLEAGAALVLPTRKSQALLAYLALPLGQAHPREKLATLLWGDMQNAQARGNLRHALSRIRKAWPGIALDGPSVALDPSVVDVDVVRFERLVADGRPAALEQITDLYRGDLLAGLVLAESPFEEWLMSERERLHELAIQGLGRLLTHQQKASAVEPAVQTGLRLLALDPLQEPIHREVMRLYTRLGRREAALRQYQLCVDALKRELSTPPEAETTQYDQKVAAHMILARILWLQGFPEQALRTARENVEDARAVDHALSLCNALEVPCLVAIWSGDLVAAERFVTVLLDHSARHALAVRHRGARCFNGALLIERGEVRGGLELLRTALDELRETSFVPYYPVMLGTLAQGLAGVGQVARALATVDEALTKSERDEERWWIAELLRIKAELVRLAGGPGAGPAAEAYFQHALQRAREQGALSLELRCATGLSRLWHHQGRTEPARELLAPIYRRFTEGFDTVALRAAETLLSSFG